MAAVPIALQLYTVRSELEKDFDDTLRQVAEIGYTGVEFAGFANLTTGKVWRLLQEYNLKVAGAHFPLDKLESNLETVVEQSLEICCDYLIVPGLPEERRRDRKKWREVANSLNEIAQDIQDYGLKLCYHNHAFELDKVGNETGFDILFEAADPDLVGAELDTYWIKFGGGDPAEYIRRMAGRCPLIHLKDMAGDDKKSQTEIGSGILDFDAVFQAAEEGGVQWYIVEQDTCARPPLESARLSFDNLKARGKTG